jgi:hypothetical protein
VEVASGTAVLVADWVVVGDWVGCASGIVHAARKIITARSAKRILFKVIFMVSSSRDKNQNVAIIGLDKDHIAEHTVHG